METKLPRSKVLKGTDNWNIGAKEKKKQVLMGRIGDRPLWVLNVSIVVRALHQLGAGVFLAGCLFLDFSPPDSFKWLVFGSGFVLVFTEWLRHRQIFRELSGCVTFVKLLLMGAAFHGFLPLNLTMIVVFLVASVVAHAPKHIRHRLLF